VPLGAGAAVARMLLEGANGLRSISSEESPSRVGRAVLNGPATGGEGAGAAEELSDS